MEWALLILSLVMTASNLADQAVSDKIRGKINSVVARLSKAISSDSATADKIMSVLQSRNAAEAQHILMSNPATARPVQDILHDQDILQQLSAEQNRLKNELNNQMSIINNMGPNSWMGALVQGSSAKIKKAEKEALKTKEQLNKVNNEVENFKGKGLDGPTITMGSNVGFSNRISNNKDQFNSISQNLQGGIK